MIGIIMHSVKEILYFTNYVSGWADDNIGDGGARERFVLGPGSGYMVKQGLPVATRTLSLVCGSASAITRTWDVGHWFCCK